MTQLTNALNLALTTGTTYSPQSYAAAASNSADTMNVASALLSASASSSSALNQTILSAAYTPTFNSDQANMLANAVDSNTLQSILQSTGYDLNTSLYNSLSGGVSLYDSTVSLLDASYLNDYDTTA